MTVSYSVMSFTHHHLFSAFPVFFFFVCDLVCFLFLILDLFVLHKASVSKWYNKSEILSKYDSFEVFLLVLLCYESVSDETLFLVRYDLRFGEKLSKAVNVVVL